MSKKLKVILNPYAGRWNALKRKKDLERALHDAGIVYDLSITEHPRHGTDLAAKAVVDGFDTIVSAGGDGSIHEVVNGILSESSPQAKLPNFGILPLGTANDLASNLNLPADLPSAAKILAQNSSRLMDLGRVSYVVDGKKKHEYFGNNSAIGLEPTITLIQEKIQLIKGPPRYIISALIGIMRNPQWTMKIEWESGNYYGPATLVTVGNHPLTGGSFYMTPNANGFDGELTFVFGAIPTRRKILSVFPETMKNGAGNYVERDEINEINSPWIKITTDQPTPLHTDGEIQSTAVHEIEYKIVPKVLPVLLSG